MHLHDPLRCNSRRYHNLILFALSQVLRLSTRTYVNIYTGSFTCEHFRILRYLQSWPNFDYNNSESFKWVIFSALLFHSQYYKKDVFFKGILIFVIVLSVSSNFFGNLVKLFKVFNMFCDTYIADLKVV